MQGFNVILIIESTLLSVVIHLEVLAAILHYDPMWKEDMHGFAQDTQDMAGRPVAC